MNGMSLIVKKVTQLMAGIIFLYGVYIMLHGHLTPGGGFAGGTIVAGSFILLIVANGIRVFGLHREEQLSSAVESIAILVFSAPGHSRNADGGNVVLQKLPAPRNTRQPCKCRFDTSL